MPYIQYFKNSEFFQKEHKEYTDYEECEGTKNIESWRIFRNTENVE